MPLRTGHAGVAIVTGAAGGIGSAAAAQLAAESRSLILCDIAGRLEERAGALSPKGQAVEILAGDLGDLAYLDSLLETLGDRLVACGAQKITHAYVGARKYS